MFCLASGQRSGRSRGAYSLVIMIWRAPARQIAPDGQIDSDLRKSCQDLKSKIFRFSRRPNQSYIHGHPVPTRGALAIVTTWDGDAVDAEAATDERGGRVRQRRVVLTSRCWRQALKKLTLARGDGGKRAVLRGDHVISRKAIAQGMSDVLRCPVCSCAHSLCTLRMRPRVQRASGIPCALWISGGRRVSSKPRAQRVATTRKYVCRHSGARVARTRNPSRGRVSGSMDSGPAPSGASRNDVDGARGPQ